MDVAIAETGDFPGFLQLASEVEDWFGPMVQVPRFRSSVRDSIAAGNAMCVRGDDTMSLLAGMLFGGATPRYHIGWLVVARQARRSGVGASLVRHALKHYVSAPATVDVVTFGADHPAAALGGARVFYQRLGFQAGEMAPRGPDGGTRQHFRLNLERSDSK